MVGSIWLGIMLLACVTGLWNNSLPEVALSVTEGIKASIEMLVGLFGIIAFWSGIMKIAEYSGLVGLCARWVSRPLHFLFPEVPKDHPAMGEIALVTIATAMGLNNAAIPLGMRAMEQLDTLNTHKGEATHAMCMLVTINASNIQLFPISTIAFLAMYGADQPSSLMVSATIASLCSTLCGIMAVIFMKRFYTEKLPASVQTQI